MLKDGIAEVGKLLFIKRYARSFDSHPKTWKAVGELLGTAGSGLQLCTLLVQPEHFLWLAASGNIAKSTAWALWVSMVICAVGVAALFWLLKFLDGRAPRTCASFGTWRGRGAMWAI